MRLEAHVVVTDRGVNARVAVAPGRTLALVGPNGSGKTTVVEALAGMVHSEAGHVMAGLRVGIVPQDGVLLPHLNALDNVAFALRARGVRRAVARTAAHAALARVHASHVAPRRPNELSGGEARRVAIARALASEPSVMLLDEPFAGLDVEVAGHIRSLVHDLHGELTMVISTHNAMDALLLADDVAVLNAGAVVESGAPARVFTQPHTAFAARMAGRVLITGTMAERHLVTPDGTRVPVLSGPSVGRRGAIALRPADVIARTAVPADPAGRVWLVHRLTGMEPRADAVRLYGGAVCADVDPGHAPHFVRDAPVAFGIPPGQEAYALESR